MENTHANLNQQAKQIAKNILLSEGELLLVLLEMAKANSFLALGYQGIFDYCIGELNFSKAQAFYYKSVAKVPELTESVAQGELSLSQARRIATVVTLEPAKTEEWIEKARTLPQEKLEQAVTQANPNAKPRDFIKPVTPEQSKLQASVSELTKEDIQILTEVLSTKRRKAVKLSEVIEWMAHEMREKYDPVRKAKRSISSGNRKAPTAGRHPISAGVRHDVIRRSGNRCEFIGSEKRCSQTRWLHLHHVVPVAEGGLNVPANLLHLCSDHHRVGHSEGLIGFGKAAGNGRGLYKAIDVDGAGRFQSAHVLPNDILVSLSDMKADVAFFVDQNQR